LKALYLINYVEAVADYTKAIELHSDPHEEDFYCMRGFARHELNDYAGAIADYNKALELNTNAAWGSLPFARTNLFLAQKMLLESKKGD
ncbi:MAG TPA: tetratricopeptide repeat protein, partial [Phycisphaerae bacterium]|nr:tetratricopeptide repeat protein [Phycisphaerae bacterium]